MSDWKNQSGNTVGRNALFNNLNYNNGIFKYLNSKLIHLNPNNKTIVGIGTNEPFSKLSFGDYKKNPNDDYTFALHENTNGIEKIGLKIYNNTDSNLDYDYGLSMIVSNLDNNDDRMTVTDTGHFFINEKPYNTTSTFNIKGSLKTSDVITIGYNNKNNSPDFGSLRYNKINDSLEIKNNRNKQGDEQWSKLLVEVGTNTNWESGSNGIYKSSKISIKDPNIGIKKPLINHALSVEGNVVIGSESTLKKLINVNSYPSGVMVVKENLFIGEINNNYEPNASFEIKSNMKPLIIAGENNKTYNKLTNNSVIVGNSNNIKNINYVFGEDNKSNGTHNLIIGKKNRIVDDFNNYSLSSINLPDYSYIFGENNSTNSKFTFINGKDCNINTNPERNKFTMTYNKIIFGEKNYIHDIFEYKNNLINDDSTFTNTAYPQGIIFGNNNNIFSNVKATGLKKLHKDTDANNFNDSKTNGYIFGLSNKIQGKDIDINCTIMGDTNECYHSGGIWGNNNRLGWKTNHESEHKLDINVANKLNSFIIGNNIINTYPWKHCGWDSYNKLPDVSVDKQPPILLTVGQGPLDKDGNKIDFIKDSTFSVDVSGNARCNNMVMRNPNGGLLSARIIDGTKFSVGGNEFDGVNHYVVHTEIFTGLTKLMKNATLTTPPSKYISIPFKGRLVKIISILDAPNVSFSSMVPGDINKGEREIHIEFNLYGGDQQNTVLIKHPYEKKGNVDQKWNVDPAKSIDDAKRPQTDLILENNKNNILKTDNNVIQIKATKLQRGYGTDAPEFLKASITLIIAKNNNL
jgi:hypothetical protein